MELLILCYTNTNVNTNIHVGMCKTHKEVSLATHGEKFESVVHLCTLTSIQPNEISLKLGLGLRKPLALHPLILFAWLLDWVTLCTSGLTALDAHIQSRGPPLLTAVKALICAECLNAG